MPLVPQQSNLGAWVQSPLGARSYIGINRTLYFAHTRAAGVLGIGAINADTGTILWDTTFATPVAAVTGVGIDAMGRLYCLRQDATVTNFRLLRMDVATRSVVWDIAIPRTNLLIVTQNGRVFAGFEYNADGNQVHTTRWWTTTAQAAGRYPALNRTMSVGNEAGTIDVVRSYGLVGQNPAQLWTASTRTSQPGELATDSLGRTLVVGLNTVVSGNRAFDQPIITSIGPTGTQLWTTSFGQGSTSNFFNSSTSRYWQKVSKSPLSDDIIVRANAYQPFRSFFYHMSASDPTIYNESWVPWNAINTKMPLGGTGDTYITRFIQSGSTVTYQGWLSRVQIFPGTVTWDIADGWYGGTGAFPRVIPGWCWEYSG
jgi:hypothetical protein